MQFCMFVLALLVLIAPAPVAEPDGSEGATNLQNQPTLSQELLTATSRQDWEEAIRVANKQLKLHPDQIDTLSVKGVALFNMHRYKQANKVFRQIIKRLPNKEAGYLNLANSLREAGDLDRAIDTYRQLIQAIPDNLPGHLQLATLLINKGNAEQSLKALRQAQKHLPKETQVWRLSAQIYQLLKRPQDQLRALRTLILLDATATSWSQLGQVLYQHKRFGEAADAFSKGLNLDPGNQNLWYNAALAYRENGQQQLAFLAFSRTIELVVNRQKLLENHPPQPMYQHLHRSIQQTPSAIAAIIPLANATLTNLNTYLEMTVQQIQVALLLGQGAQALLALLEAERTQQRHLSDVGNPEQTRREIEQRLFALQDFASGVNPMPTKLQPEADKLDGMIRAISQILRSYEILWADTALPRARKLLAAHIGSSHPRAGDMIAINSPAKRLAEARKWAAEAPQEAWAQLLLGLSIYQDQLLNRVPRDPKVAEADTKAAPKAALAALHLATKADPQLAPAWLLLGAAHAEQENWRKASKAYEKLLQLAPESLAYRYRLALYEEKRFQYSKAISHLQSALRDDPKPHPANELRLAKLLLKTGENDGAYDIYLRLQEHAPTYADALFNDMILPKGKPRTLRLETCHRI